MGVSKIGSMFAPLAEENRMCEKHGEYRAMLVCLPRTKKKMWTGCLACMKEKTELEDAKIREQAMRDRARQRAEAALGRAAIPERFANRKLDNYKVENEGQRKALASATRYIENWKDNLDCGTNLIFAGKPGTGKTHLAIGIAHHVIENGGSALYSRFSEVVMKVKESFGEKGKGERQVIDALKDPDLLIIDEAGKQLGTDFEKNIFFEVINARYEDCKPTILITNLQITELSTYLDPAALDRLREGGGRVVSFDWDSERSRV